MSAAIWPYTFRIRVEQDAVWVICDLCETEIPFGRMATVSELILACQQHRCHRDISPSPAEDGAMVNR